MENICEKLIDRYFDAACNEAGQTSTKDKGAYEAARNKVYIKPECRVRTLAEWIREYKVHRVKWKKESIDSDELIGELTFADAVATIALKLFDEWDDSIIEPVQAYTQLRNAIGEAYRNNTGQDRTFRSVTAKVLWCAYPDKVAIYDDFASQAATTLTKIYKSYYDESPYRHRDEESKYDNDVSPETWKSYTKAERDIWWYRDFFNSHAKLFTFFEPHINKRLEKIDNHPTPFRVFDKFLWLYGNPNLDYSLIRFTPRQSSTLTG